MVSSDGCLHLTEFEVSILPDQVPRLDNSIALRWIAIVYWNGIDVWYGWREDESSGRISRGSAAHFRSPGPANGHS